MPLVRGTDGIEEEDDADDCGRQQDHSEVESSVGLGEERLEMGTSWAGRSFFSGTVDGALEGCKEFRGDAEVESMEDTGHDGHHNEAVLKDEREQVRWQLVDKLSHTAIWWAAVVSIRGTTGVNGGWVIGGASHIWRGSRDVRCCSCIQKWRHWSHCWMSHRGRQPYLKRKHRCEMLLLYPAVASRGPFRLIGGWVIEGGSLIWRGSIGVRCCSFI